MAVACVGGAVMLFGAIWQHLLPHSGVFDLPIILSIIGLGVLIFGISSLAGKKKDAENVVFSGKRVGKIALDNAIILAMLLFIVSLCIIKPNFMQVEVITGILQQASPKMFIALGVCFSLIIAGTDLSAGRLVAVSGVVVASLLQKDDFTSKFFPNLPHLWIVIPILAAIAVCMLFGTLNGFLVAQFKMHPFIATLATQVIAYGAVSLYFSKPPTNGQPIGQLREDFKVIGQTRLAQGWDWIDKALGANFSGLSILVLYAIAACVIIWFVLNKTTFGKNVYAVGGNPEAARVSGVNSYKTIMLVFIIGAVMYAIGGILEASRGDGATNNLGNGYELDAIAACVVGGVSLSGGVGKVKGIIIGVLIFQVIAYGLVFIGVSPYYQQIIKGIIIAAAVALDLAKYNKS